MKKFLLSILCCLMAVFAVQAQETATLSFASTDQRTSYSTSQQVWEQNGITFTNNKASSTTNVANYSDPVRLYANSEIVVECSLGKITQIVFNCDATKYATALQGSIEGSTVSGTAVTVTPDGTSNSFTATLSAQVRLDDLTVTYTVAADGEVLPPSTPTLTAGDDFVGSTTVEITCTTEGATIYYTTDESVPSATNGTGYTAPFEITTTTTVNAIAINEAGESGVSSQTYTRVAAKPEIAGESTFDESVVVTVTFAEGTTAYYTLNGKTPTANSTEYTAPLTIKADATLQVIAIDAEGYPSRVAEQEFKQNSSSAGAAGTATLIGDAANLAVGDQVIIVATGYDYALSTTQNTNNRAAVAIVKDGNDVSLTDEVQILTIENGAADGQFAFQTGSGYLYAASTSSNHLKTTTTLSNKASFTIGIEDNVATIKADQSARNWLRYNPNSGNPIFSCYTSGQQDVSLYKVNTSTIEDYVLDVTAAKWATLFLGYNVTIPEGVKCYIISNIGAESVELEGITGVVPANTAVLVNAEEGEYTFEVSAEGADVESNMLGSLTNEYIDEEAYVLSMVDGEVGLYKAKMNGGVFLNNANKAYLPASVANGAASYSFSFDWGGTTGIENIEGAASNSFGNGAIYDITGRKINEVAVSGIYIIDGKKVFIRK
ncbi:MAG: chitobiase/beta-hexosaminidase C-terminal domain-containing protein [Bacteroidaceae bacterium]|nr:chitobiase/beta-hexosaminidase C-terminal domain-containing protein [Bacteroidaceae bacterium]